MAAQVANELGKAPEARAFCERGIAVATRKHDGHALSELNSLLQTLGGP
jgi:hypothetical protein